MIIFININLNTNIRHGKGNTIMEEISKMNRRDFPGGPVVKNPPSNGGNLDLIPG